MIDICRLTAEDDLGDLIALSRAFFDEYQAHDEAFFEIDELHDDDIAGYFSRTFGTEDGATFIAVLNGRIVGYITVFVRSQAAFYKIKRTGAISGLMVHQDQRRKGIASRLLAEARRFFQEQGIEVYTVYTAVANEAALAFYRQQGLAPLQSTLLGELDRDSD